MRVGRGVGVIVGVDVNVAKGTAVRVGIPADGVAVAVTGGTVGVAVSGGPPIWQLFRTIGKDTLYAAIQKPSEASARLPAISAALTANVWNPLSIA